MYDGLSIEKEWEQIIDRDAGKTDADTVAATIREILVDTLQLETEPDSINQNTQLLGALPELDSMAVVGLLSTLEQQFDFVIQDEEVTAEVFETFGSLVDFVERNLNLQ